MKWHFEGLPLQLEHLGTLRGYTVRLLRGVNCFTATEEGTVGLMVPVPQGWVTDLTSLPEVLPISKEGPWTPASVIHDYLYATGRLLAQGVPLYATRKVADEIFYEAMLSLGVRPRAAFVRWAGVRLGGWRAWRKARKVQHENRSGGS